MAGFNLWETAVILFSRSHLHIQKWTGRLDVHQCRPAHSSDIFARKPGLHKPSS